jgi:hypothetical protein
VFVWRWVPSLSQLDAKFGKPSLHPGLEWRFRVGAALQWALPKAGSPS